MSLPQSTCHYCPVRTRFVLIYLDNAEGMPVCQAHLGDGYDLAERENKNLSFLPVHISRVSDLVAA